MSMMELEVVRRKRSWVIALDGRPVSGSATREGAERVARYAAESLERDGHEVILRLAADSKGD